MVAMNLFILFIISMDCFRFLRFSESLLVSEEVDALQQIASTMGSSYWKFNADACKIEMVGLTPDPPQYSEHSIDCECNNANNSDCHVTKIILKGFSLPGMLPPQLVQLPYLREIDFAYNYLNGTIPSEWASSQLTFISVLVNRLSGEIPIALTNITTLTYLNLEANQFSGSIPSDLGKLINLQTLMLSSNLLTGKLPESLAKLINLTDFRINDNNFHGTIPNFLQNWKQLSRLEMQATGLEGPIPSEISLLNKITDLRISDIIGPVVAFPMLENMTDIVRFVLRNCNISGEIPSYIWTMKSLQLMDVSFNKLVGELPPAINAENLKFMFLCDNLLTGDVPDSILKERSNVDLSYNNLTWQGPQSSACRENRNLNVNLFRSSSVEKNPMQALPCKESLKCPQYSNCLHINCGGTDVTIKENNKKVLYQGDGQVNGGAANYYINEKTYWGFSSTGDFMDDNDYQNTRYTAFLSPKNISELYSTARIAPISLTYFHYCLENGNYTVNLHFAEIRFTNDKTYYSLGKRIFNVYVQETLVLKDFNIEDEAPGAQKPLVKQISNVAVTNNMLEIKFYWAGKGTTRVPDRGVYGPMISAISVVSDFKVCANRESKRTLYIIIGVGALCFFFALLGIVWWSSCFRGYLKKRKDLPWAGKSDLPSGTYRLKQIRASTNDFDSSNKIGEGGFGPVYKGLMPDGTFVAVKQLSSKSRQGNREFLNEIGIISCLQHPNLVKLHGFCVEGDQLLLVYEYMENNSLARALFGPDNQQLRLDWPTRLKICIGIAKGLAFLHEESRLKIVHRDIKATNVLLDKNLNPKISDFGLARLNEEEKTHVSTRVAGTIGYMAPEYALWGHLSEKADVYSFGVLALEIISGKSNNNFLPAENFVCLLDWAYHLQQSGNLVELVDEKLGSEVKKEEVDMAVKVALLCTNASSTLRPVMSQVVCMLEQRMEVPSMIPDPSSYKDDLRFKAMRDLRHHLPAQSSNTSRTQSSSTVNTRTFTSTTEQDLYEIGPEQVHAPV